MKKGVSTALGGMQYRHFILFDKLAFQVKIMINDHILVRRT